jgi:hypothetical protein
MFNLEPHGSGSIKGYEAGVLGIGIAYSDHLNKVEEWSTLSRHILSPLDEDKHWYDKETIYKSTVIWDKNGTLGHPFVMYYNAKGSDSLAGKISAERISMAVSDDMINWKRFGNEPVIDHKAGISGDAFITRIDSIWVMFYFGAFWKPGAF